MSERLPDSLRSALGEDLERLRPVRPLKPPASRALAVAAPALLAICAVAGCLAALQPGTRAMRVEGLGIAFAEWGMAWVLAWAALREAVPGMGHGRMRNAILLAGGLAAQALLAAFLWRAGGGAWSGPEAGREIGFCAGVLSALMVPQLAFAVWLMMRALPLRPGWSGALAGAAAGLFADSIWHLVCGRVDFLHLAVAHTGTVAVATVAGWCWGRAFSLRAALRRPG